MNYDLIQRPWGLECRFYSDDISGVISADGVEDIPSAIADYVSKLPTADTTPVISVDMRPVSNIDVGLIDTKDRMKSFGIVYLKTNPLCSEQEYLTAFANNFPADDAGVALKLLTLYIKGAMVAGYIPAAEFSMFRDFVYATPAEILEAM